jgi:hypothetical protein
MLVAENPSRWSHERGRRHGYTRQLLQAGRTARATWQQQKDLNARSCR